MTSTTSDGGFASIGKSGSGLIIEGCRAEFCSAVAEGGGLKYEGSPCIVRDTVFVDCHAEIGGGMLAESDCTAASGYGP
eukprot:6819608-Prymnesium_polylepis.1